MFRINLVSHFRCNNQLLYRESDNKDKDTRLKRYKMEFIGRSLWRCNIWRKLFSITRIPRAKMFMTVETKLRSAMLVLEVSLSFAASVVGLFAILRPSRWFPPRGSTQCCKIKRHDTLELPWSQKWCSGKTKHDHTNVCTWVGTTNGVIWWPPWSQAAPRQHWQHLCHPISTELKVHVDVDSFITIYSFENQHS